MIDMKEFIFCIVVSIFILTGCNANNNDEIRAIKYKYPNAQIETIPNSTYKFIVYDGKCIRYVETLNIINSNITKDTILMVIDK